MRFLCLVPNFCKIHHLRDNDKFLFQFLYQVGVTVDRCGLKLGILDNFYSGFKLSFNVDPILFSELKYVKDRHDLLLA